MAVWGSVDLLRIQVSAVNYDFAPNALKLVSGYGTKQKNQVFQESESGEIKILTLSDNVVEFLEFAVDRIRAQDYTVGASLSVKGAGSLYTLITSVLNYRANTCEIWLPGTNKALTSDGTFRLWQADFSLDLYRYEADNKTRTYYGDGSQILRFRKEI